MLKGEFITIPKKGNRKLDYYKSLGYDISQDFLQVKIIDLNPGSNCVIEAFCDYCFKEISVPYKEYRRNIAKGNKYACSKICGSIKAKETNLNTIGRDSYMKLDEIQKKVKSTNMSKYGHEYPQQSKMVREKTKNTLLNKWGVDHISKSEHFKEKFKETCLKNLGVEYPMQSTLIREKSKDRLFKNFNVEHPTQSDYIKSLIKLNNKRKYGVDSPSKLEEIKNKIKSTKLEKYGDENYNNPDKIRTTISEFTIEEKKNIFSSIKQTKLVKYGDEYFNNVEKIKNSLSSLTKQDWEIITKKRKNTNIKLYGNPDIKQSELFRKLNFNISKDPLYVKYLTGGVSLFRCDLGHDFEIDYDNYYHRKLENLNLCTICNPIGIYSFAETQLLEFIKSIYPDDIIQNYRDGMEIDIFLPRLKIGFEFNGLYWHSEKFKNKDYHLRKNEFFNKKGIRVFHIWEDDWKLKKKILKSQIKNWIGITECRIYARSCKIKELNNSSDFLNMNHIQGADKSIIKLGLYNGEDLVSIMTFNKVEGRKVMKTSEWNLSRFCNKIDTLVIGGASKLLKYFITKYRPSRIISYSDSSWSNGGLYLKLGFKLQYNTSPDYKYIIAGKRVNKINFTKKKLKTELTENEYMRENLNFRIWDCGKSKFYIDFE